MCPLGMGVEIAYFEASLQCLFSADLGETRHAARREDGIDTDERMAAYGVPPALGVAPELNEAVSTGVRGRRHATVAPLTALCLAFTPRPRCCRWFSLLPVLFSQPSRASRSSRLLLPPRGADHDHGVRLQGRGGARGGQPHLDGHVRRQQGFGQDHPGDGQRVDVQIRLGACPSPPSPHAPFGPRRLTRRDSSSTPPRG